MLLARPIFWSALKELAELLWLQGGVTEDEAERLLLERLGDG